MLYVFNGSSVVNFKTKKVVIDVARAEAGLQDSPLRVRETFDLPPGKYAAKVLGALKDAGVRATLDAGADRIQGKVKAAAETDAARWASYAATPLHLTWTP